MGSAAAVTDEGPEGAGEQSRNIGLPIAPIVIAVADWRWQRSMVGRDIEALMGVYAAWQQEGW